MSDLVVRQAIESDAESFLDLWDALDSETEFMLFEPNERKANLESQKSKLKNAFDSENVRIIVLENTTHRSIVGFCAGQRRSNFRYEHSLHIVIGIMQSFTGQQWGQRLLLELEAWALNIGIRRLDLSVMAHNYNAISLYRKLGYQIEGTKKEAVFLRSGFVDEHIMGKLI